MFCAPCQVTRSAMCFWRYSGTACDARKLKYKIPSVLTDKVFTPSQPATFNLLHFIRYPVHIIKLHLTSYFELTMHFSASNSFKNYLFSSFRNSYSSLKLKGNASQPYFRVQWRFLPSVTFWRLNCWKHTDASENSASFFMRRMTRGGGLNA